MRKVVGLLIVCCLLSACKQGSFLERRFDNFTAHYNKFYNAKRSFLQGEDALERQQEVIDQERYLLVFPAPQQAARSGEFEKAISKSADILRSHPRSKWVDDALMLIGKSYFYQQEYVGAEQKFREIMDLGGPLIDETRFWLARTLVAAKAFEAATELLDESLALEDLNRRWAAQLRLVRGELHVQQREWEAAAEALALGLEDARDRETASRAQFLLGQVYETMGRYEEATEAYARVQRHKPLYELSYAALVNETRTLTLQGAHEEALALLRKMRRDDKHFSYYANLELLRGRVLKASGAYNEAFRIYDDLLYEPESNAGALRGRVHYAMAELYRDGYRDFFLAAAHFDTAATALRTNRTSQELITPYAIADATDKAGVFTTFRTVAERILRNDSLLALAELDEAAFDSAIAEIRLQRAREAERRRAELAKRMAENRFRNAAASRSSTIQGDFSNTTTAASGGNFGFLNYKDADRFQEGYLQFQEIWGERPLVDNWRRRSVVAATLALQAGEEQGALANEEEQLQSGLLLPPVDISEVPRDAASRALMLEDQAAAQYELANVLFLSMSMPDSAANWYRLVIEETPESDVAKRAYFALAEVQLALNDTLGAHRIYRTILEDFPESSFAVRARERLGRPAVEEAPDSLALARDAYEQAYKLWQNGRHQDALEEMIRVVAGHPRTDIAPRAMLATGLIYTQWTQKDEQGLFRRIPLRDGVLPPPPDSILAARRLADSLSTFDAPARAGMESDSLAERAGPDSLAAGLPPDSLAAGLPPDSSAAGLPPDSTAASVPADSGSSSQSSDSANVASAEDPLLPGSPAESGAQHLRMDTTAVATAGSAATLQGLPADSASVPVDSTAAPAAAFADSTRAEYYVEGLIPQPLYLETLYASVEQNYPSTPYAERARELLKYLDEHRPKPAPDSVASDSVASDSLRLPPDSLGSVTDSLAGPSDSLSTPETRGPEPLLDAAADTVNAPSEADRRVRATQPNAALPDSVQGPPEAQDVRARPDPREDPDLEALKRRRDQLLKRQQQETARDSVRVQPDTTRVPADTTGVKPEVAPPASQRR